MWNTCLLVKIYNSWTLLKGKFWFSCRMWKWKKWTDRWQCYGLLTANQTQGKDKGTKYFLWNLRAIQTNLCHWIWQAPEKGRWEICFYIMVQSNKKNFTVGQSQTCPKTGKHFFDSSVSWQDMCIWQAPYSWSRYTILST